MVSTLLYSWFRRPPGNALLIADAFGLAIFTVIGARVAEETGASSLIVVLMGAITGAAGGVVRDMLCVEIPLVLCRDVYATAAIAGASLYVLLGILSVEASITGPIVVATIFILRLAAIKWDLHVPTFTLKEAKSTPDYQEEPGLPEDPEELSAPYSRAS